MLAVIVEIGFVYKLAAIICVVVGQESEVVGTTEMQLSAFDGSCRGRAVAKTVHGDQRTPLVVMAGFM